MPEKSNIKSVMRVLDDDFVPFNIVYQEGLYHFYHAEKRVRNWVIARLASTDLINWERCRDVICERFPAKIGTGSAIFRNGRIYLLYDRRMLKQEMRIISSRNGVDFEQFPLPALRVKPKACDPRVFYSNGAFYMVAAGKGGIFLYHSSNLFDWQYRMELLAANKESIYSSPSIVRLGGKNFIIYSEKNKKSKTERTCIVECKIDIDTRYFSLDEQVKELPVMLPRTSALKDGRVLLIGFVNTGQEKSLSIYQLDYDNRVMITPLQEWAAKRRESFELVRDAQGAYKLEGFNTKNREIIVKTRLNAGSIAFSLGDLLSIGYNNGTFTLFSGEEKQTAHVGEVKDAEFDIIIANGLCEVYFGGTVLALPIQHLSPDITIEGNDIVSVTQYVLQTS